MAICILFVVDCRQTNPYMSVSEVWQMATKLDGQILRIRGPVILQYTPYHPMQIGGCSLELDRNAQIVGKAVLLEAPRASEGRVISISEASFQCLGDTCGVTCQPFAPPKDFWGHSGEVGNIYEFEGRLRVDNNNDNIELVLEDVDVADTRQLVDGRWEQVPTGIFSINFP